MSSWDSAFVLFHSRAPSTIVASLLLPVLPPASFPGLGLRAFSFEGPSRPFLLLSLRLPVAGKFPYHLTGQAMSSKPCIFRNQQTDGRQDGKDCRVARQQGYKTARTAPRQDGNTAVRQNNKTARHHGRTAGQQDGRSAGLQHGNTAGRMGRGFLCRAADRQISKFASYGW